MIDLGRDITQRSDAATAREWLETNGIGGFASSTASGLNSRRYHGLLVAATNPPAGRVVLLSKLEESVVIDGRRYDLSTNRYSGVTHPHGYQFLERFRLDPFPVFTFSVDGIELDKSVFMVYGQNTTVVQYHVRGQSFRPVFLEVRPLVAFRDYHSLTHENTSLDPAVKIHGGTLVSIRPYQDLPELYVAHDSQAVNSEGYWYRNLEYELERERGLDFVEDLFNPMTLRFDLNSSGSASIVASVDAHDIDSADRLREIEIKRRAAILSSVPSHSETDPLVRLLTAAADQYIVARGGESTIIAGYPWFTDWGRDTMIALPGLTLATGRVDTARSILLEFARHVDRGMLPNRFPDAGKEPEYNTIDATLWYFEAVRALLQQTNDYEFVHRNLHAVLTDIIDWHIRGTRYGIQMDEDGLIASSDPSVQLTWMDAKIGDWVVTPRHGKAVEIQALWYNALRVMQGLARSAGKRGAAKEYARLATRASRSFNEIFWNEEAGCLYDTVKRDEKDPAMRPNQILAISLTHSMLAQGRARQVVGAVERELLTPYGLRSLSDRHSSYRGRYEGDPVSRDSAYHQGPVWPWLLGPFIDAYVKVHGRGRKTLQQVHQWLSVFGAHLSEAGLGHISEILDGDAPHQPRGCFAQAWSVAEVLRVAVEANLAANTKTARKTG